VNIAREAVDMHLSGKSPKEIYHLISGKYSNLGEATPTPAPK
jgi:rRNA processing protein Krr1/Pno1